MTQNETKPIEVGACYRDPGDGEIARVLEPADGPGWRVRTLVVGSSGLAVGAEFHRDLRGWERVPDPTPALVEDETARQARVDATARACFASAVYPNGDLAYQEADALEAARERYIAARRKRMV